MFPTINVQTVKLSECRRVVLYHYNKEEDVVEQRHYAIRASPVGLSRPIKRLVQSKIPDLHDLQDISELVEGGAGAASDSEAEDETSHVVLPEKYIGKGNAPSQKR
jgi:ribosome biogenesis protein SSF1/2